MAYWIQKAIRKKGALRRTLGVGPGGTIPLAKLQRAAKGGGVTARRARLALTLRRLAQRRKKK
jgi:hypothetical protein